MRNEQVPVEYGAYTRVPAHAQVPLGYDAHGYDPAVEEPASFDPLRLFWFVIHYRWLISCFVVAAIVCGIFYNFSQTPRYRATTKIEILTNGAKVFQDLEVVAQSNDLRAFETARQKMLSRDLANRVVFETNLAENSEFLAPRPSFSLKNILNRVLGRSPAQSIEDLTPEQRQNRAAGLVSENLNISIIRNTSILSVSYDHPSPQLAALVANQVANSFIDQGIDKKSETSGVARQFIEDQAKQLKERLQESEKKLVQYAQDAGITVTGSEVSLIGSSIAEINTALSEAVGEKLAAERFAIQVENGNAATLPEVFESESIQSTKLKIAELKATYQQKLGTLKPGFPEMRRLNAQIRELEKQVRAEVGSIGKSVLIKYEQSKAKEEALKLKLAELEQEQSAYQKKNIQYTILKREVDSNRSQYESLIGKLNEVGVGSELRSADASIVDVALTPRAPISPRLLLNLALSMLLFGGIAGLVIYILELMNNTFVVPDQLETELGIPVLGVIPFVKDDKRNEEFQNTMSPFSEAYRTLRTSVQFTGTDDNIKTLMVTSSEPSEGKTTTSFKLAEDFAALGRKVLVIDADLRKPRMHHLFNTDNGIGLSNLLTNVVQRGDVLKIFHETDNPNITFLSAGTIPPNPTDLLVSQKMGLTIHFCAKKYDLVIIDCPPVMGLSDAPIISRQVDATLFVVSAKQVTRKAAKNALQRLRAVGGNVVGCTLTKFKADELDYNYAYRYMQKNYYSYDSGAGQTPLLEKQ